MAGQEARFQMAMLRLIFIMGCWLGSQNTAWGKQVDITVDDTDPSIIYLPASSWQASSNSLGTAVFNNSFHNGTHPTPTADPDDFPAIPSPTPSTGNGGGNDDDDGDSNKGKGKDENSSGHTRRFWRRDSAKRLDADDPGFVDTPVTAQFTFNGTAISLFAIKPGTTAMNLTFNLDNNPSYPAFIQSKPQNDAGFQSNVTVFSQQNLDDGPHTLLVTVGTGTVFLFDYMVYTTTQEDDTTPDSTINIGPSSTGFSGSPVASQLPSQSMDAAAKRHNVATFGAAVGGTVGVLSIFAMGLAFSIIRRRQKAAKRDRQDRESLHTNASEDTPPMIGPRPFVPRYFPGTVVPADPPAYMDSISPLLSTANHLQAPLLSSLSPEHHSTSLPGSEDLSYADIPPPTQLDDGVVIPSVPPPSFPMAIATPPPVLLSAIILPPGLSGEDEDSESEPLSSTSHEEETVGSTNPVPPVTLPEAVVLPLSRSRSRASSHSSGSRDHRDAGS